MLGELCTTDSSAKTAGQSNIEHEQLDSDSGMSSQSLTDKMEASIKDSDEEDFSVTLKKKQSSKKKMTILDDSDSEVEMHTNSSEEKENAIDNAIEIQDSTNDKNISSKKISLKKIKILEDSESEEEMTEKYNDVLKERNTTIVKKTIMFNSDLFDAEDSEDDTNKSADSDNMSNSESETENKVDEGYSDEDDLEMSKGLKAKLARMKGAAKKEKPAKVMKPQKQRITDLTEIHSESQRLVRESAVRLPYHKPKPKGLSVFLARTQQKQAQLGQTRASWKHSPLPSLDKCDVKVSKTSSKQNLIKPHSPDTSLSVQKISPEKDQSMKLQLDLDLDEDDLPDLIIETSNSVDKTIATEPTEVNSVEISVKESVAMNEQRDKDTVKESIATNGQIDKDSGKENHLPEQDSGFLTATGTSGEESNENSTDSQVNKETDEKTTETFSTPLRNRITQADSSLTPTISQLTLGTDNTPTLSGGAECFIDLDEDENKTPQNSGMKALMDRLMKHSKSQKKKPRDVQISTVHKENVGDNKEELKLETLTFHIEGDGEDDQKLQKPGAKLLKLKENLQAEMKRKREEARKVREEAFHMDNEEGFEEEEAELTDQSDTDVEEEEDINEEEDMEANNGFTKIEKNKNNPFVEDEAEDEDADDEDESDEEHLHLELDSDNEDSEESASKNRNKGKKFLSAALEKTKTMDLFDDDDAYTSSPSASQVEKSVEAIELSERPFSQLSGEKSGSTLLLDEIINGKESSFTLNLPKEKDTSISSMDTSFDIMASLIPAGQRSSKKSKLHGSTTPDLFTPSSKGSSVTTENKNHSRLSEINLPIEDTQDLLDQTSTPQSQPSITPSKGQSMLKFNSEDDTQSLMLDAEGLLRVNSSKKPTRKQLLFEGNFNSNSQETDDELLDLCSGKFTETVQSSSKKTGKGVFSSLSQNNTQENHMDELLDLCSGAFTEKNQPSQVKNYGMEGTQGHMDELLGLCSGTFSKQTQSISSQEQFSEENSQTPDLLISDPQTEESCQSQPEQKRKKRKAIIHDSDSNESFELADGEVSEKEQDLGSDAEDTDDVTGNVDEDDEEEMQRKAFLGFKDTKKKHGKIRREFVEDEAELSGSEYDSDENYDLDEKEDQLEAESGDEEILNDEELRNQVGRVHLKTLLDDDKRDVRLFQEMYLADGDLHSEGGGRTRRFKWKNVDDDSQEDLFNNSDEEVVEEETEEEMKWRLERHQREKFIQEQKTEEEAKKEEGQVLKLGKSVFKPKHSHSGTKKSEALPKENKESKATNPSKGIFKLPFKKAGSFLTRSKGDLAKMAEMSKPVGNVSGPRNSRNFVFTAVSPDAKESKAKSRPPPVKRSASLTPSQPTAKRSKLDRSNSFTPGSIFNHL